MAKERDSDSDRVIGEFIPGDLSCDDGKGFLLGVVVVCFVGGGEGEGEGGDDDVKSMMIGFLALALILDGAGCL